MKRTILAATMGLAVAAAGPTDDALTEHAKKGKEILSENLDKINQIEARLRKARTSPGR